MTITKKIEEKKNVWEISGWLDTKSAPEFQESINTLDEKTTALTLDLEELAYISSAGLRLLVSLNKKMNGNLTLRNVPKDVMDVLKIAGFDRYLKIEE